MVGSDYDGVVSTKELTIERLKASARMPRKVIQVAVDVSSILAVCDDGTVWRIPDGRGRGGSWQQMPPIPQDD